MNPVLEALKEGRETISNPARWTQAAYARPAGKAGIVSSDSRDAVCWCSVGALFKVRWKYGHQATNAAEDILDRIAIERDGGVLGMIGYNDRHTHAEVLAVWDEAIAQVSQA